MKSRFLIVLVLLVVLAGLGGCQSAPIFTPEQQSLQISQAKTVVDSLKDVSTQLGTVTTTLKEIKASAATQPASKPVVDSIDHLIPPLDNTKLYVDGVTKVADTFGKALEQQGQANATALEKISAVTTAVATTTHEAAPGTPVDNYAALAAVLVLGVSKIVSSFNSKSTLKTAITTPGTTEATPKP